MSNVFARRRMHAQPDKNQRAIIERLAKEIPEATVLVVNGDFDLLIGYRGVNLMYEVKNPESKKSKTEHRLKPKQIWLRDHWRGQYRIVSSYEEILNDLGRVTIDMIARIAG